MAFVSLQGIEGFDRISQFFSKLDRKLKRETCGKILKQGMRTIAARYKLTAPVDTGQLQRSISSSRLFSKIRNTQWAIYGGPRPESVGSEYAFHVESGHHMGSTDPRTRQRLRRLTKLARKVYGRDAPVARDMTRRYIPPNPKARQAFDANKERFTDYAIEELGEACADWTRT